MQKRFYITTSFLILALAAYAQTSNPFDLKWRRGSSLPEVATDSLHNAPLAPSEDSNTALLESGDVASTDSGIVSGAEISSVDGLLPDSSSVDVAVLDARDDDEPVPPVENSEEDMETSALPDPGSRVAIGEKTPQARRVGMALFLVLFVLALVILTWAVNINRGFLQKIYRAALNENFSALLLREQRFASSQYLYYIVYTVFFLNGALFLFLISRYATWDLGHRDTPLIMFLLFIVGVYSVKHFVTRLLGETFLISKEMTQYNFTIILFNILAGIALMPVNLLLAFGPGGMRMSLIFTGLTILMLMYIWRQFRGIVMGSHLIVNNVFQFFVYLCTIEILPVLVLIKFFPN